MAWLGRRVSQRDGNAATTGLLYAQVDHGGLLDPVALPRAPTPQWRQH